MGFSSKKKRVLTINTCSLRHLKYHTGNFSPLGLVHSWKYTAPRCVGRNVGGRPINPHVGKALKLPLFLVGEPC